MLSGLDGILFGRQTIGIESHRMKHIKPLLAFVAGIDVAGYITQRVSHVQAGPRGVGEHVQHIIFRP